MFMFNATYQLLWFHSLTICLKFVCHINIPFFSLPTVAVCRVFSLHWSIVSIIDSFTRFICSLIHVVSFTHIITRFICFIWLVCFICFISVFHSIWTISFFRVNQHNLCVFSKPRTVLSRPVRTRYRNVTFYFYFIYLDVILPRASERALVAT